MPAPRPTRVVVTGTLLLLLGVAACSSSNSSYSSSTPTSASSRGGSTPLTSVARPVTGPAAVISGPVTGGKGVSLVVSPKKDLATAAYHDTEWFAAGTARSYRAIGALGKDGRWNVTPAASESYRTRVLSFVPDASKFNGTVLVEWLNVTAGFDLGQDLMYMSPEIERSGYAWVGVSAQQVGVNGLRGTDPARYGTLRHPGDPFAFDIFSQVARAVWDGALKPIRALRPQRVLAVGQSQSAFALTTYINAIQPTAHVFDGFFVHSRGGGAIRLDGIDTANSFSTGSIRIRTDVDVPILLFETETDEALGDYFSVRQPDTDRIRLWDIAGASHEDAYLVPSASAIGCKGRLNEAPTHYVVEAALQALDQWVHTRTPPPSAPRLAVKLVGGNPVVQRDPHGIAIGGIRTAAIDVPVAAYSGVATDPNVNCSLIGSTQPFSATTLAHLYPSQQAYLAAFTKSTDRAIADGYILPADRSQILASARQAHI
jgi:hypothetical protein